MNDNHSPVIIVEVHPTVVGVLAALGATAYLGNRLASHVVLGEPMFPVVEKLRKKTNP